MLSKHCYTREVGKEGRGVGVVLPIFGTTKTSAFLMNAQSRFAIVVLDGLFLCRSRKQRKRPGDSRNKTRPAKVVVEAN